MLTGMDKLNMNETDRGHFQLWGEHFSIWLVGWLAGWLVGLLVGWLVGWLVVFIL